jgi:hypothetical protein
MVCIPWNGPRFIAEAGIGFIWLGVRMAEAWGWGGWSLTSTATPTPCLPTADSILLAGVLSGAKVDGVLNSQPPRIH